MKKTFLLLTLCLAVVGQASAIDKNLIGDSITAYANRQAKIGRVRVTQVLQRGNNIEVQATRSLSDLPFNDEMVAHIRNIVSQIVLGNGQGKVRVITDGREISEFVHGATNSRFTRHQVTPLTTNQDLPYKVSKGLQGKHIAMYGSHGIYYNQNLDLWKWQRAKILTTVEDVHTTGYTMPFVVPMLENAGAVVIQPRERDTHTIELVIDDEDITMPESWTKTNDGGFKMKSPLLEGENPFTLGGYAYSAGDKKGDLVYPISMPEADDYALYVSYKTLDNSTKEGIYTVVHEGQQTKIAVNQQMGGGTWVYLGTFRFGTDKKENYVSLSSITADKKTVTTDAIKVGGGMGSVARYRSLNIAENVKSSDNEGIRRLLETPVEEMSREDSLRADSIARLSAYTSGYPRWLEGSRYWFQYAGIPDSVYNFTHSKNDYTDDYASRGRWANYLAGGSEVYPDGPGLQIPIDLFLAFHSDAGVRQGDTIIGTLIIYTDYDDEKKHEYETGVSRMAARDYADLMQTEIVNDMRVLYAPEWQRRQLQNSSYAEARNPKMPAVLLELLSHQNFADMRYSLDPRVKFTISRSIYKGMLKFVAEQYQQDYVVQPLPVKDFAVNYEDQYLVLTWEPQLDPLEPTAEPNSYVVYTKENDKDWDNGKKVNDNTYSFEPQLGVKYDFKVVAANRGGVSLPSEELSACINNTDDPLLLIVNGFNRVCAPDWYADSVHAGFIPGSYGVPYKKDVTYIGAQYEFRRDIPWRSDDNTGAGGCYGNYATITMVGNMFNYPTLHGSVLKEMGLSYISMSASALNRYSHILKGDKIAMIDLILGKQKETTLGVEKQITDFKTFTPEMQQCLTDWVENGKKLLVSGAYIGSDLHTESDIDFMHKTLHVKFATYDATQSGRIRLRQPFGTTDEYVQLQVEPDEELMVSENPDGLDPFGAGAKSIGRFFDTQVSAGALWQNPDNEHNRTIVFSFPIESTKQFKSLYTNSINILLK